jgi:hypothetical protein
VIVLAALLAAELTLERSVTVTPVPVSFRFSFSNASAADRDVPHKAVLIITPAGGEPFIARWRGSPVAELGPKSGIATVTVPANGKAELELLANPFFDSPGWFTDPRLYSAGKKELQVVFSDVLDEETSVAAAKALRDAIVSSAATIEIKPATGDDARVCELLRRELRDEPCPLHAIETRTELLTRIWKDFPASTYRNYLVSRVAEGDLQSKIARLEGAVADQRHPALLWNLAELARLYETAGSRDKAREIYERLAKSPAVYFRDLAKQRLSVK